MIKFRLNSLNILNKLNIKNVIIFIFLFITLVIFIFLFISFNNNYILNKTNNDDKNKSINIYDSKQFILNMNCKDINNRYTYIKNENEIIIGTTKKEIENGFYDIYILNKKSKITIKINKLFINYNVDNLYDENYLNSILIYLNKLIDIDITILKNDIIKYYKKSKDIHNTEKLFKEKLINKYKFSFNIENNELILMIEEE